MLVYFSHFPPFCLFFCSFHFVSSHLTKFGGASADCAEGKEAKNGDRVGEDSDGGGVGCCSGVDDDG